jgi:hypothetical protein
MSASSTGDNPYLVQSEIIPNDPEQLNIRLTQIYQNIANKTNNREISIYALTEQETGQQYFDPNNVLAYRGTVRKVVKIPALSTGANSIAHGITFPSPNTYKFTQMYGSIFNSPTTTYSPVPNGSIEVTVDLTNININIPVTYNGYTGTFVLEWART